MAFVSQTISTNGATVAVSVTATSSSVQVPSIYPTNKWFVANTGANPVQVRVYVNTTTGTASFPVPGTSSLGLVMGAGDDVILDIPASLTSNLANLGGFTTTLVAACIALTGTNMVYITPLA